jgi:hypothetical protein
LKRLVVDREVVEEVIEETTVAVAEEMMEKGQHSLLNMRDIYLTDINLMMAYSSK